MNPLCDPVHYNSKPYVTCTGKSVKTEQVTQYISLIILMDVSYVSVFHASETQAVSSMAWLWPAPLVFSSNLWWFKSLHVPWHISLMPLVLFQQFLQTLCNFLYKMTQWHASLHEHLSALQLPVSEKGNKRTQKPSKIGSSLPPLPAVNNVMLFQSPEVHTGHHSQHLPKV